MTKIQNERLKNIFISAVVLLVMLLIYGVVYITGGIKFSFSHSMYIPIIFAGLLLGHKYGLVAGVIAGLLLGPFMPLVVETGEKQELLNWIFRLTIFMVVGGLTGIISKKLRNSNKILLDKSIVNPNTRIHNTRYLQQDDYSLAFYIPITLIISTKIGIINTLYDDLLSKVMVETYKTLKRKLGKDIKIIQAESNKLWILNPNTNNLSSCKALNDFLDSPLRVEHVDLYVDYYCGVGELCSYSKAKTLKPFIKTDQYARYAEKHNIQRSVCKHQKNIRIYDVNLFHLFPTALKNNETYLVYQPIVDSTSNETIAFEALIRWNHKGNKIYPNDFIPLIENSRLVHNLTYWVLETAIIKLKEFEARQINIPISVNMSAKNFTDLRILDKIKQLLDKYNVNPEMLVIEITETVLLYHTERCKEIIDAIKEIGIKLAFDDFGTGYSSLSYMSQLHLDFLKIDKNFIDQINDDRNLEIVKSIVELAHKFSITVIAEGVETLDKVNILKSIKCNYIQGYYYSKPLSEEKLNQYIQDPTCKIK